MDNELLILYYYYAHSNIYHYICYNSIQKVFLSEVEILLKS